MESNEIERKMGGEKNLSKRKNDIKERYQNKIQNRLFKRRLYMS